MKKLAVVVLLGWCAIAQEQGVTARFRGGCGPAKQQYEVKAEQGHHAAAQPTSDKALVYVMESLRSRCFLCDTTTRVGLDGAWVGANKGDSYFSFSVDPGEHHLCAELQSGSSGADGKALNSFTAEVGKTYYFRSKLADRNSSGKGEVEWVVDLESIDGDEGQFLAGSYGLSSFHGKK
jgi:hypothetical protein